MSRINAICVYCASSDEVAEPYKKVARDLGVMLAERGIRLVYGGGRVGLMGIIADSALEAGGEVVGIIPKHLKELELGHGAVTELFVVDNMHKRKNMMVKRADAFVILPGGLGTLDETFEILTWRHLKLHDKPIIIVNSDGYWQTMLDLIDRVVHEKFADKKIHGYFSVVDKPEDIFPLLER